ncbi:MAG TPA: hypothetical protein VFS43_23115 [Polyangiaceae bacterium]|nr:hypothetical protein [Polyangiaceae bacterium]
MRAGAGALRCEPQARCGGPQSERSAPAAGQNKVSGKVDTSGANLNVRSGPSTSFASVGSVADGASVYVRCREAGQSVSGPTGTTSLWGNVGLGDVSQAFVVYPLFVFAGPALVSALIESALALASERVSRRAFLVGGMLALSLSLAAGAASPWPWLSSLGLAAAGAAGGCACAAAQASLVEASPRSPERAMARWSFFAALGDVATPPLVALALGAPGARTAAPCSPRARRRPRSPSPPRSPCSRSPGARPRSSRSG